MLRHFLSSRRSKRSATIPRRRQRGALSRLSRLSRLPLTRMRRANSRWWCSRPAIIPPGGSLRGGACRSRLCCSTGERVSTSLDCQIDSGEARHPEHLTNAFPVIFPQFLGEILTICSRSKAGGKGSWLARKRRFYWAFLVLPLRIELRTSPLPRECSTTELRQRNQ